MKERPILFSAEMVRAILDGRKTMTRRVVKPQPVLGIGPLERPPYDDKPYSFVIDEGNSVTRFMGWRNYADEFCPYGVPGDRLWVRERFRMEHGSPCYFTACPCGLEGQHAEKGWKPSIHMPRWASRITLEIESVKVERVQDISADDCEAEGVVAMDEGVRLDAETIDTFHDLWDSINANRGYSWDSNPWVWVIAFKRITP